ncbi:MAG: GAF domain-containing protein [Chloroflexi bacterium]|nr:GAF domain-containing protein [Chloroflexota bacterium]
MLEAAKLPSSSAIRGGIGSNPYKHGYEGASRFQDAVADLGQIALEDSSLDSLFRVVLSTVAQLMSMDLVAVMEVEDDRLLRLTSGVGWPADCLGTVIAEWETGNSSAYPSILRGPVADGFRGISPQASGMLPGGASGISTTQTVPVGKSDSPLGALGVFTYSPREFNSREVTFLRSVAQILAGAIERSRIEEKLRGEAEERTILSEIARIIGSSLEIEEVYSLFAQQVRRLIAFDRITINLIDQETDTYSSAYITGMPVEGWKQGVPGPITGKGVEAVTRTRAGIIVQGDKTAEFLKRYPRTLIGQECGLHSLLSVPVFWQGDVIGVLALRAMAQDAYSNRDLQVAERIAAQIAGSLANSALHASQKAYAREQSTLAEISRVIASSARLNEIFPRFADAVRKLIPFDRISINTVDEDKGTTVARYVWGVDYPGSGVVANRPLKGSATGAVTEARTGMIISADSILARPDRFAYLKTGLEAGLNSTIAVPVMYRGRVVGSLMLRSLQADAYSLKELTFAERVAAQISGAVRNIYLNEQLERAALEHSLLAELGRGTIQARDLTTVFDQLHSALTRCFEFDRIEVGIHDADRSSLRFDYVRGLPVLTMSEGYELQRPANEASNVTWADILATHNGKSSRDGVDGLEGACAIRSAGLQSWLHVPLKSRDRVIGVISLRSKRENAYTSTDLHLLERVAAQISPAVDNVRFYCQAQQDAQQRTVLEEMIRAFGQVRNRNELLANFKSQIRDSIPADCVTVSSSSPAFDQLADEFNLSLHGDDRMRPELAALNGALTESVVQSRCSVTVDCEFSEQGRAETQPELADSLARAGFRSSLSVPLLSAGVTVAVLHFHSVEICAYSQRYRMLAEQAGMLLMNALAPLHLPVTGPATGNESHGSRSALHGDVNRHGHTPIVLPVVLIDSQGMCRQMMRTALHPAGISIAAESYSPADSVKLMRSSGGRILLWEIHEEDAVDFTVVSSLLEIYPDAGVVLVDNGCGPGVLSDAMRSGVRGFLLKDTPPARMSEVLREIAAGGSVFDPRVLKSYFERFPVYHTGNNGDATAALQQLGERDLAILQAVANGQSNAEIAAALSFAVGTIKNRLARIYKVLGVSDRAGAMAFVIRAGIVA